MQLQNKLRRWLWVQQCRKQSKNAFDGLWKGCSQQSPQLFCFDSHFCFTVSPLAVNATMALLSGSANGITMSGLTKLIKNSCVLIRLIARRQRRPSFNFALCTVSAHLLKSEFCWHSHPKRENPSHEWNVSVVMWCWFFFCLFFFYHPCQWHSCFSHLLVDDPSPV